MTDRKWKQVAYLPDEEGNIQKSCIPVDETRNNSLNDAYEGSLKYLKEVIRTLEVKINAGIELNKSEIVIFQQLKEAVGEKNSPELVEQNFKRPESVIMPKTKVSKTVFNGKTNLTDNRGMVRVSRKNASRAAVVPVKLFISEIPDYVKLPKNFTPYDKSVFNGICSILETGQDTFTSLQVYRAMGGNDKPKSQAIGSVTRSINKMRTALISIDWTEHAKLKGLDTSKIVCIETNQNMVYAEGIRIRHANGLETDGFHVLRTPVLYTYSKNVEQICTIPRSMLDVNVKKTDENIVLLQYLAERLDTIKNQGGNNFNKIKYQSIFDDLEINVSSKSLKKRHRDYIKRILVEWAEKGTIKSFNEYKQNSRIEGVEIEVL